MAIDSVSKAKDKRFRFRGHIQRPTEITGLTAIILIVGNFTEAPVQNQSSLQMVRFTPPQTNPSVCETAHGTSPAH